jgi:hypothetical protein
MPKNHKRADLQSQGVVESKGQRPIWERLDGESRQAFEAFSRYRDLGQERSTARVAQELSKSKTLMDRWSGAWNWVNRCWEFDAQEDERTREQLSRDRLAMRKRQIAVGQSLQSIAAYGIRELQTKIALGQPLNLTPAEIVSMMECGAELERRAMGEEKDHRCTRIIVNFGTCEPDPDEDEQPLIEGGKKKVN